MTTWCQPGHMKNGGIGMLFYGYQSQAFEAAERVVGICLNDIEQSGGMHENYDAETGLPLAAPNFGSWNLLLINLLDEIKQHWHPLRKLMAAAV